MSDDTSSLVPIPDPTILTTEQLFREIARLDESMRARLEASEARLQGEINLTSARFNAVDQDHEAIRACINGRFIATEQEHQALRELLEEKLSGEVNLTTERFRAQERASGIALVAAEGALKAALSSAEKAVEKANAATDKRFDAVNEFRGQLGDIQRTLISRAESEARMSALDARISDIKTAVDKGFTGTDTRRETIGQYWGYIVGAVGVLATVAVSIISMMHLH